MRFVFACLLSLCVCVLDQQSNHCFLLFKDIYGVNYDYSTVWRVIPNQRIDIGAVTGKFVARENPNFISNPSILLHDAPGVVSVRKGNNDGGFGFTIYPGGGDATVLNEDNIVVGRVLDGMDVIQRLNEMPVVKSAGVNYMAITGGPNAKNAPSRACRYGGPMYCNENKPLKKVLIEKTGIL
jgi:cyclophilin family peptidyl-prolyl cis-trans isomerase